MINSCSGVPGLGWQRAIRSGLGLPTAFLITFWILAMSYQCMVQDIHTSVTNNVTSRLMPKPSKVT